MSDADVSQAYEAARDRYAEYGVDTDAAIEAALSIPVSLHCWQADDVVGLESLGEAVDGGGIMSTGSYPGKARNGDEIRQDLDTVMSLLPGVQRVNVHAFYAEFEGASVDRDGMDPSHFARWIDWAKQGDIGLDFNSTFFAHPKANDGYTLSHADAGIRDFWIQHGVASRQIAEHMGRELGKPCVLNHWTPDGAKDHPADRWGPRQRLSASLDAMLDASHGIDTAHCIDAVESKLFGIGSEDFVVGSAEFYLAYAIARDIVLCLDMGHFHPTETIHDKISAILATHRKQLLIHTSRPIRWDSDHVVIFNDDVRNVFLEIARGQAFERILVALDFFDASINRIAAYVIGTRATRQAILYAMLDPSARVRELEAEGKLAQKLAMMENAKIMPFGAVWDMLCVRGGVPSGDKWVSDVEAYESSVLAARS